MKRLRFFITLISALAIAATFSFAGEGEVHHRFKFKVDADSEPIVIDDLEVGETRQFFTDSGKEVVVTREEDGLELTVDGKEIDVATPHGHHGTAIVDVDGDDGEHVKVFVKKIVAHGEGEDGEHVMVWHGAGEHAAHDVTVWHGEEGEGHASLTIALAPDVAESVLESGVLDDLDPAKREEILEAIKEAAAPRTLHEKVIVHEEEDHDD